MEIQGQPHVQYSQLTTHNSQLTLTTEPRSPHPLFSPLLILPHGNPGTTSRAILTIHNSQYTTHNSQLTIHINHRATQPPSPVFPFTHPPTWKSRGNLACKIHNSQLTTHINHRLTQPPSPVFPFAHPPTWKSRGNLTCNTHNSQLTTHINHRAAQPPSPVLRSHTSFSMKIPGRHVISSNMCFGRAT